MPITMGRKPNKPVSAGSDDPEPAKPRKPRNVIFLTLDDITEWRLRQLIDRHRIKPDRAAVALTGLIELLDREKIPQPPPAR